MNLVMLLVILHECELYVWPYWHCTRCEINIMIGHMRGHIKSRWSSGCHMDVWLYVCHSMVS